MRYIKIHIDKKELIKIFSKNSDSTLESRKNTAHITKETTKKPHAEIKFITMFFISLLRLKKNIIITIETNIQIYNSLKS
jgi:hypothetical protein